MQPIFGNRLHRGLMAALPGAAGAWDDSGLSRAFRACSDPFSALSRATKRPPDAPGAWASMPISPPSGGGNGQGRRALPSSHPTTTNPPATPPGRRRRLTHQEQVSICRRMVACVVRMHRGRVA